MKIPKISKIRIIFLFLLIVVSIEIFILEKPSVTKNQDPEILSDQIIKICSKSNYHPSCYDKEIPKLMDYPTNLSMEDSFQITRLIQNKDKSYQYCHVLGHNLSAKEVQKNPSQWKDVVSRCPSGMCSNGCIHGGFQEKFRAESLTEKQIQEAKPDLSIICENRPNWHPTGLEQASCYHALGHLTMYITSADITKSLNLCKELAYKSDGRDFRQLCYDGVFMQIYQPLEPEDFALIRGREINKDQVDSFCNKYQEKEKASCISESWPLFRQDLQKPEGLVEFCSKEESTEQDRCYTAIIYVLTPQFNFDSDKISSFCMGLPDSRQGTCFANAASRMIETDYRNISNSVNLCSSAPMPSQDICFNELFNYSSYNFHAGSAEFLKLCNSLPDSWKIKCLGKT